MSLQTSVERHSTDNPTFQFQSINVIRYLKRAGYCHHLIANCNDFFPFQPNLFRQVCIMHRKFRSASNRTLQSTSGDGHSPCLHVQHKLHVPSRECERDPGRAVMDSERGDPLLLGYLHVLNNWPTCYKILYIYVYLYRYMQNP